MNFNQFQYWPGIFLMFAVFLVIVLIMEKRFFRFVKTFWFYKRSFFSYVSSILFLAGMFGLLISLLDIRGPEEKIKTEVPSDRTIILIDTSASMLAEDVKPSRLQKAALIAKHFARKAAGHQLSVVAFAEVQKKIVPFTNDLELIDARLDSLKNLRNQYGSSALSIAIQESIQYFREADGVARGNILVLTDGEETAEGIDLKVPKDVHVALVGVGTEQGGRIPLDDGRGFRFGYKKDSGRDVITKLNEGFFSKVSADLPSARYWIANSYSLPSEEILEFFQGEKMKGNEQQDMIIKPVLMEWIVVPSVILLLLSYLFKSIRVFTLGLLLIVSPGYSQEEEQPKLTPEIIERMNELQEGKLNQLEKLKLADDLYKAGAIDESLELYDENLPKQYDGSVPAEAFMNYGTALLGKGQEALGMAIYNELGKNLKKDSPATQKIHETMDKNVVTYFKKQEEKKKKQQENKDQNKDNNQKQDNQSGSGQQQDNKDQKGQSGQQQNKDQKDGQDDKNKDQKKDQNKDGKDNQKDDQKPEDQKNNESEQDKSKDEKKKLPPQKLPAKLKQLMSDDRQLQMKMIENGTRDLNRRKSRKSKDW